MSIEAGFTDVKVYWDETPMVERVAKAIAEYWERVGFDPSEPSEGAARAAIEAMREPTKEMIDSAPIEIPTDGDVVQTWEKMIDVALGKVDAG